MFMYIGYAIARKTNLNLPQVLTRIKRRKVLFERQFELSDEWIEFQIETANKINPMMLI